nr:ABC transporter ATP-binding protein [Propionicimonas sp.]
MPTITLDRAVKNYGAATNAVDGLDLHIDDGDFMCLLGPSGCGKTTTIRMIAGLETATAGRIVVGDRVVDEPEKQRFVPPEDRRLGLVFQSYALWPHLTVSQNVAYGLKLRKMPAADRARRVEEVMSSLGIAEYRDRYPAQLSGGQQQRVALARMLAVKPETMLLDEPLSNLDSRLRLEMRAELKRIHAESGATTVFVTHDQWEAMTLATRVAVMSHGVLQQVGTPLEIYDHPQTRFVAGFLGVPPINFFELDPAGADAVAPLAFLERRGLAADGLGSLGIRPESLRVGAPGQSAGDELELPGRVESLMPTGGSWTTEVRIADRAVYATSPQVPTVRPGGDVVLRVKASALHVFDRADARVEVPA